MNESQKELTLQELYNKNKQNHRAPETIAQSALAYAKRENRSPWRFLNWQTSFAIICVFVLVGHWQNVARTQKGLYTVSEPSLGRELPLYYHNIEFKSLPSEPMEDVKLEVKPDQHYENYMASLAKLKDNRRLSGIITRYDDELVVRVCDLGFVKLSEHMVTLLNNKRALNWQAGQAITLLADSSGKLIGIESSPTKNQCPS
jgi:hypothetical protein